MLRGPSTQQGIELWPATAIEVDNLAVENRVSDVKRPGECVTESPEGLVKDEDGHYEHIDRHDPSAKHARLADSDLRGRMRRIERGEDAGIRPAVYKLWARGVDGDYRLALEIRP
jgi:hypothetical protein